MSAMRSVLIMASLFSGGYEWNGPKTIQQQIMTNFKTCAWLLGYSYTSDCICRSWTVRHANSMLPCTVWCRYNVVNFLQDPHKWRPVARPLGRGMGCLYGFKPSSTFCHSHRNDLCKIMSDDTSALLFIHPSRTFNLCDISISIRFHRNNSGTSHFNWRYLCRMLNRNREIQFVGWPYVR